jgi:phosphatase NudJ
MYNMNKIKITTSCGVFFNDSILMIKELQGGRQVIDIPAGGLDDCESVLEGVKREVLEETGVVLKNPQLKAVFQCIEPGQTTINFLYSETLLDCPVLGSSNAIADEDISETMFLPISEIREMMTNNPDVFEHALALKRLEVLFDIDDSDCKVFTLKQ